MTHGADPDIGDLRARILALPPDPSWCGHFSFGHDGSCFTCARDEEVRAIREAAWDEGHELACDDYEKTCARVHPNPYRAPAVPPG